MDIAFTFLFTHVLGYVFSVYKKLLHGHKIIKEQTILPNKSKPHHSQITKNWLISTNINNSLSILLNGTFPAAPKYRRLLAQNIT